ncbi:MAG: ComF family protein, partial [Terriglobia bacterium]
MPAIRRGKAVPILHSIPRIKPRGIARFQSPLLQKFCDGLASALFPTACPLCRHEVPWSKGMGICRNCANAIKPWEGTSCAVCGLPFASSMVARGSLCALCQLSTYRFDVARSYGIYTHPLRDLILHLKFRRRERWGYRLGGKLASLVKTLEIMNHGPLIIPVPLH